MTTLRLLAATCLSCALGLSVALAQPAASPAAPATAAQEYTPRSGQAGKDVVWVPTAQALVDRMLDMANVTPQDYVIDLGSGDGRTVITAAKRGVKAHGIEYNPDLVALSQRAAQAEGVADKATFVRADIFQSDFSSATVLTLFLLPELNMRLRPTILDMKPGTRVVSNSFTMEEWTPDQTIDAGGSCVNFCRAHFWLVPAKVEGAWKAATGEIALRQSFQMLSGTVQIDGKPEPLTGKMTGAEIAFTAGGRSYSGRVDGARIEGKVASPAGEQPFSATRAGS